MLRVRVLAILVYSFLLLSLPAMAGFSGNQLVLPAAGRVIGAGGEDFITTIWVSNPTQAPISFQMQFLAAGQSNPNPPSFADQLQPGETKTYENVVETVFGIRGRIGALRFLASDDLLASARIHHGEPLSMSQGVYFAAVPTRLDGVVGFSVSIWHCGGVE